jgi:class 3 adenylate cyclase
MKNFLSDQSQDSGEPFDMDLMDHDLGDRPIADLFPETTIMFADIAGFTAWSSVREPSQVFTLLERIYGAFDKIALKRGMIKVGVFVSVIWNVALPFSMFAASIE